MQLYFTISGRRKTYQTIVFISHLDCMMCGICKRLGVIVEGICGEKYPVLVLGETSVANGLDRQSASEVDGKFGRVVFELCEQTDQQT